MIYYQFIINLFLFYLHLINNFENAIIKLLFYVNLSDNPLKYNEKKHLVYLDLFFKYNQTTILFDLI